MVKAPNPGRELAIVAAALLLPVPLLAATALHLPLPAAVERGLASLTPGGSFDVPTREAAPTRVVARRKSAGADQPTDSGGSTPDVGGRQAASSTYVSFPGGAGDRESRADRPQEGASEPPETLPPDTDSDNPPGGDPPDAPLPEGPPVEPDTPPTTAAPAAPPTELAVGLDAGGVSTEVEAGADGIEVTVSRGDALPPTTVPLPPPPALPVP